MTINRWYDFLRPSSLGAIELCPGRPEMEGRATELVPALLNIEHPQAKQGTMGHLVIAQTLALIYNGPGPWMSHAEALEKMAGVMNGLDAWTRDSIRRCIAYSVGLVESVIRDGLEPAVFPEMHLSGAGVKIPRGGTADLVIVARDQSGEIDRVIIQDQKLGFLDQGHAAEHSQLHAYAVMAFDKFFRDSGGEGRVDIHLAQGRLRDFTATTFRGIEIEAARRHILAVVAKAKAHAPELNPGLEQCRYCKALSLCRAARERIMNAIEESALFGVETADRVKLMEDAQLAARFAEEARALQKEWVKENREEVAA